MQFIMQKNRKEKKKKKFFSTKSVNPLLYFSTGINGFLDFTCINRLSRIQVDGDDNYFIGGYNSGDDREATKTFERVLRTYNTQSGEQGLPAGSYEQNPFVSKHARRLYMPREGGDQRVGAYFCDATKGDETERITTTVMSKDSKIILLI